MACGMQDAKSSVLQSSAFAGIFVRDLCEITHAGALQAPNGTVLMVLRKWLEARL